jgi:NAD(P)-dependent dehydrogenase (short-subunit alcohol dehydrogenase family)
MLDKALSDLSGKSCVITGGAGVLGSGIAACLARYGVKTAILDLNGAVAAERAARIAGETGGELMGVATNVLDRASLVEAQRQVQARFGRVDILLNAAGGNSPKATTQAEMISDDDLGRLDATFFGLDAEAFRSTLDLNLLGTVLPSLVFCRDMAERKSGVVLNFSSMNSFRPLTRIPAYSAAKASINNFTAWLAVHLAKRNVRVNAIAPGFFLTEQNRFLLTDKESGRLTPRGNKILAATPTGRFGEPEDLLGTVLFLVSDMSRFVTGVVIPVDGGFSAYSGV